MILSRKSALYFLLINSVYLVYTVVLLICLKERVILDIYRPPLQLSPQVWVITQIVSILLYVTVFVGLIKVLFQAKERLFIVIAFALFTLMRLFSDGVGFLAAFKLIDFYGFAFQLFWPATLCILIYLTISVFFIKSQTIRKFYVWFVIVTITTMAIPTITGYLADNFNLYWTLLNPNVLKMLPCVITLTLYYRLYQTADQ